MAEVGLWDTLSADYDRFVNWGERLPREMPFLDSALADRGARRILDVACGTGRHAVALAKEGYEVLGTDISEGMIRNAQRNAEAAGVSVAFLRAGFGALRTVTKDPYDAILCLGNSLPALLSEEELHAALEDMAHVLAPGGLLIIQNLNYDRVWTGRERFMPLQTHRQGDEEWLFLRFVDFHEKTLTFNMVVLHRQVNSWGYAAESTELRPILKDELAKLLARAGFGTATFYGDYTFSPYERETSDDLIVVAQKEHANTGRGDHNENS